jgi:hypothetical protein
MQYKTKSAVIGRMKRKSEDDTGCPAFIHLHGINNPHESGNVPDKMLDWDKVEKIVISGLEVNYLLAGNDLVINSLEFLDVKVDGPIINVSGKHKK